MSKINIFTNKGGFFNAGAKAPFLGIDWGLKRIGLAVSDDNLILASPIKTVGKIEEIVPVVKERKIGAIVLGYPLEMSGNVGKKAKEVEAFAEELHRLCPDLPILLEDERLTSFEAEHLMIERNMSRKKRKGKLDQSAAALILQGILNAKGAHA